LTQISIEYLGREYNHFLALFVRVKENKANLM
jgi:hypothetical protein